MDDIDESTARAALNGDREAQESVQQYYAEALRAFLHDRGVKRAEIVSAVLATWSFAWEHTANGSEEHVGQLLVWIRQCAREWLAERELLDGSQGQKEKASLPFYRCADRTAAYAKSEPKSQRSSKSTAQREPGPARRDPESREVTGEAAVIVKALTGERAAKRRLVEDNVGWVHSSVSWRGVPSQDRDDVTHNVLVKAIRALDGFVLQENGRGFRTWLGKITMTCTADYFQERRKHPKPALNPDDHEEDGEDATRETMPLDATHAAALHQALEQMSKRQRSIFIAYYHDGLTLAEIVESMDSTQNKVYALLEQAREIVGTHFPEVAKTFARRKSGPPTE